jgi:hypothetical protein
MTDKKLRVVKAVSWISVAVCLDLVLGAIYYLQGMPEYKISTLLWTYAAYGVVGSVSHYLLARYLVTEEKDNDPGS